MLSTTTSLSLKDQILDLSRQNQIAPLSSWFTSKLDEQIRARHFLAPHDLSLTAEVIVNQAHSYREQTRKETAILGMSGGVDSALTAAILKKAGYRVIGVTMPIHQNSDETDRGVEACEVLGIRHIHKDLTRLYDEALLDLSDIDEGLGADEDKATKIRRGNVRARLRMITLYNLASLQNGFVASTDNWSELTAGFWTLHGDVGDVAPIQGLLKSWEVPFIARLLGVPEATVRATPTDGLGIAAGDEAQLGASYLQWDIMALAIADKLRTAGAQGVSANRLGLTALGDVSTYMAVVERMERSWFKRINPVNLRHYFHDRYEMIGLIDRELHHPQVIR